MLRLIIFFAWLTIVSIVPKFHHALSLMVMQRSKRMSGWTDRSGPRGFAPTIARLACCSHLTGPPPPRQFVTFACPWYTKSVCCKYFFTNYTSTDVDTQHARTLTPINIRTQTLPLWTPLKDCVGVFQMFQMYVVSVPYGCCKKVDLNVAYVAMAIHVCCECLFKMFHQLQTYVASVLSKYYICCSGYTHMLQEYILNVSSVSDVCCRKCFHVASVSLVGVGSPDKRRRSLCAWYGCCKSRSGYHYCNGYTRMLQVYI
jgi:hypothetical protein